ncbi:hypothetical protein RLEG12_22505 [Rhizobium leguminosarum bv. trifolii CB782]|uniref:Transmembrane protein n=1 Tax=Rhizobium hidalgonense TaxID=1538159 RepID=A0A2A6KLZ4_9HYPH|nr:hypothetical protein [Rhizobium hidalgonense]AHG45842.1 hypothetical protein RLEG12_22505 [Rhizobium leguminosarum bv. trifolii CB782]EJC76625.1 hypothetical protein Rleg10DRAFT_5304 [Rhizobium leguminosarum bv. trifolii WSM2012]MDR9771590.1 hypothetical protein [Rhizobium hidalgonense]MDR9803357.1 hypothetical protein [Rhizobium hidalgonense]MDR9808840.1 hypothetical protein [Rhizobium hidalgonense]
MKHTLIAILFALTACASVGSGPQPLPGSLTYGGKVVHSPYRTGTVVKHTFLGQFGDRVFESYVVQADGTLKLTSQSTGPDFLWR